MKFKGLLLALCAATIVTATAYAADGDIKVFVDNEDVVFDQVPTILNGRTMVPVRAVFEKAGAKVEWDDSTKTATISNGRKEVSITLGNSFLTKNGTPISLDVPATIISERLLIPVRAISEAMDYAVSWNGTRNSVLISTDNKAYRPNCQWKTGFRTMKDGGFYVEGSLDDIPYFDLNGDNKNDKVAFVPATYNKDETRNIPALWINGECFNQAFKADSDPYAIAIVDLSVKDSYNELIVFYHSEDISEIGIYRYDGTTVTQVKANDSEDGLIEFNKNIFVDNSENLISDFDGLCFLENMVCTGMYSLEDAQMCRYQLEPKKLSLNKTYKNAYQDDQKFFFKSTNGIEYVKGDYVGKLDSKFLKSAKVVSSNDISSVKILDCYIDSSNPSSFEFYIELADGTEGVLWNYMP